MRGAVVNLDVTAPGATLALGLMFMRTNARRRESRRGAEHAVRADRARPDFVLLRVVAHSLIMWDEVRPTLAWVETRAPPIQRDDERPARASASVPGAGPGPDQGPGPGPGGEKPRRRVDHSLGAFDYEALLRDGDSRTDREAVAQSRVHALAGACVALGLRFAGTADADAAETLREMALRFLRLKSSAHAGGAVGRLVDRATLETCVGCAAVALGCVMAGTGDVRSLRLLRRLRLRADAVPRRGRRRRRGGAAAPRRPPAARAAAAARTAAAAGAAASGLPRGARLGGGGPAGLTHGAHCAIAQAIGFLFLGGGTKTFSNDPASVAALLCATYPRYPTHTADNRCHLQAFRHLHALAARDGLLECVDAATGRPVYAPLRVTVRAESAGDASDAVVRAVAPCVLPEGTTRVEVCRGQVLARERANAARTRRGRGRAGASSAALRRRASVRGGPDGRARGRVQGAPRRRRRRGAPPAEAAAPVAAGGRDRDGRTGLARTRGDPPPPFSRATGLLADDAVGVFLRPRRSWGSSSSCARARASSRTSTAPRFTSA